MAWLHRDGIPPGRSSLLEDAVRALDVAAGEDLFASVSAESRATRAIRTYLRDDHGVHRRRSLAIAYWKAGASEELHDAERHDEVEEEWRYHSPVDAPPRGR